MRKLLFLTLLLALGAAPARALTGPLYGMGSFGEIYVIDPGDASTTLLGTVAGVTFHRFKRKGRHFLQELGRCKIALSLPGAGCG